MRIKVRAIEELIKNGYKAKWVSNGRSIFIEGMQVQKASILFDDPFKLTNPTIHAKKREDYLWSHKALEIVKSLTKYKKD